MSVSTSGLRWLSFAVVVQLPWSPLYCSLPFLHVLLTTPKVSAEQGIRHRTVAERTKQVVCWLRRALPGRPIRLIGDGAYSVIELGLRCQANGVTLIAPLRLDARLFDPPPSRRTATGKPRPGRPPCVGVRLPNLEEVATLKTTCWHRGRVKWYGGGTEIVDWATGTALWYSTGTPPLPIRWVLVRDPQGKRDTVAYFSTDVAQPAPTIISDFVKRWAHEVTFEEARLHLGVETQRQWSERAIERTTPALFGLFSLVVLMAHAFCPDGQIPLPEAGWYPKTHATFRDLLSLVRRRLWPHILFQTAALPPDLRLFLTPQVEHLLSVVCY